MTLLDTLIATIITENPWWLKKETRYISIRHNQKCDAVGMKGTCTCSPDVRLMHNASKEQSLQGEVFDTDPNADVRGPVT